MSEELNELQGELLARYRAELQRRYNVDAARHDFSRFVMHTFPNYDMGWFHKEICSELQAFYQAVREKKSPRLIICTHPRSGKSELVSRRFPAWVMGQNPDTEIIACSYSATLAEALCGNVQGVIDNESYHELFPDTTLSKSAYTPAGARATRTAGKFTVVNRRGAYLAAGVGGSITGMGADILIIDDPVKGREAANSPTIRDKAWDWFTADAYTRLSPGAGVIIMCTRWHCDDLVGRVLSNYESGAGEYYKVINYPAIAEEDEPHRKRGEPLHPSRFSLKLLDSIRTVIGGRDWASLYQQRPVPEGGGLFKESWIRYYRPADKPVRFDTMAMSWDMTFNGNVNSDYVVGQVWGRKGADYYLLDQVRGQWDFVQTVQIFVQFVKKWPDVTRKLVEDKANGAAVISTLSKSVSGITKVTPTESKTSRAYAASVYWEAGNVHLPHPLDAPWMERDFIPELLSFPAGKHDDQVDAMTQALNNMKRSMSLMHPGNIEYLQNIMGT